jgi:hypothetical protein
MPWRRLREGGGGAGGQWGESAANIARRERCLQCALADEWNIPPAYDFTRSTRDNYIAEGRDVYGEFKQIRAARDFAYHGNYTKKRQLYQDMLVKNVVGAAVGKKESWIVFTAGAMGAGKSHVVQVRFCWPAYMSGWMDDCAAPYCSVKLILTRTASHAEPSSPAPQWMSVNGYFPLPDIVQVSVTVEVSYGKLLGRAERHGVACCGKALIFYLPPVAD